MSFAKVLFPALMLICSFSAAAYEGRVIVKYRPLAGHSADDTEQRMGRIAKRQGLSLRNGTQLAEGLGVVRGAGFTARRLAAQLVQDPEVEYAIPDQLRTIRALPNDPLYSGQWYLEAAEPAATRVSQAWDKTTGSNLVVAVVDTGIRGEHPDLVGKVLPGFDFVSDAANANDGGGRDSDATDPGDYISAADLDNAALKAACSGATLEESSSSWHGTRVAGIIGAATNNSVGIAGTSWLARILPVRVLGKCGGYDSDIIAGMRWAAGLAVPGVPLNPNPAKIVNVSLGGEGSCSLAYANTINELTARGVLVVAAAGNESGPVTTPGNCAGVLAVGGVRHIGTKVGYSSVGPEVSISAPAGNCVNTGAGQPCLFSIATLTNNGTTTPGSNGYTDQFKFNVGTSFSAPQVAGVAALMMAVNPALAPADVISRIKGAATPFPPPDSALPICPELGTADTNIGQCNCTTATCGAGLLNASAAVAAAAPPAVVIQVPANLVAGGLVLLDGSGSRATSGGSIASWRWSLVTAPAGASLVTSDAPQAQLQALAAGRYTVSLTVTDSYGNFTTTESSFDVSAPVVPAPTPTPTPPAASSGGGGGGGTGGLDLIATCALLMLAYWRRITPAASKPPAKP